jgi:endonuclease/exonuclease/phosphatase family metal-dependent hydrolase
VTTEPAIRLLTLNTLFTGDVQARLGAIGRYLGEQRYDLVCLQELMYRRHLRLVATSSEAADAYPYRAATGTIALSGGLAMMSRSPLRQKYFRYFPPTRPIRPEYLMRKGAQRAQLTIGGRELVVINTHLSANRDDDWDPGNRYARAQAVEVDRLVRLVAGADTTVPLLLVGDLNMAPEAAAFGELIERTGLRPVPTGPTYRPTPGYPDPHVFDHVLVRGCGLRVTAQTVLHEPAPLPDGRSLYVSDHYGVEATIGFA